MALHNEPVQLDHASRFSLRHDSPPVARRSPIHKASSAGAVDGAWWPRSTDLVTELRNFESLFTGRSGVPERVTYNVNDWQPLPRQMTIDGYPVRLDGYRDMPAHTLCALGPHENRLVLLVIPPGTEAATARSLQSAAASPGNELTADELIAADTRDRIDHRQSVAALRRWDDEGGRGVMRSPGSEAGPPFPVPPPSPGGSL